MDTTSECPETGACFDFSELGDRNRAISRMCSEKPYVLVTSPLCTALSKLTSLNVRHTSPSERKQIANKAQRHLEFICKLIMIQHRDGRYFNHEHPGGISSWQDQCVQEALTVTQATITEFDQCLFGLMATDRDGSLKHCRRRSKLVSTMPAIDSIFSGKLCQVRHDHAHLAERETHDARVHPSQLCKAIATAIKLQKKWDASGLELLATVEAEEESPKRDVNPPEEEPADEILEAWDDASGEDLLTQPPSWRPGGKKSHTTKQWELSRRSRYHSVLAEPDASQLEYDGETSTREIGTTSMFAADWWQRSSTTRSVTTCSLEHHLDEGDNLNGSVRDRLTVPRSV